MISFVSTIPSDILASFCRHWKISEFAIFGSALREDFNAQSDLDVLVAFAPEAEWSLLDHIEMQLELEKLFRRSVDLITKRALLQSDNWIRREEILKTVRVIWTDKEVTHGTR